MRQTGYTTSSAEVTLITKHYHQGEHLMLATYQIPTNPHVRYSSWGLNKPLGGTLGMQIGSFTRDESFDPELHYTSSLGLARANVFSSKALDSL